MNWTGTRGRRVHLVVERKGVTTCCAPGPALPVSSTLASCLIVGDSVSQQYTPSVAELMDEHRGGSVRGVPGVRGVLGVPGVPGVRGVRVALLVLVLVACRGGGVGRESGVVVAGEACADAPPAANAKFTCMQYACLGLCAKKLAFLKTSCPATCGYCEYDSTSPRMLARLHQVGTRFSPRSA